MSACLVKIYTVGFFMSTLPPGKSALAATCDLPSLSVWKWSSNIRRYGASW